MTHVDVHVECHTCVALIAGQRLVFFDMQKIQEDCAHSGV